MTGAVPLGDITDDATSYHAVSVDPVWAGHLIRTVQIGNHVFYRAPLGAQPVDVDARRTDLTASS